ncbi:hypothetical protein Ancab_023163 [Ancistrocladus abbreviatus]
MAGVRSAAIKETTEGGSASPSSPSTTVSVVPDSFDNCSVDEQHIAVETTSGVMPEFSKFHPAKAVLDTSAPIENRPADGMVTEIGRNHVHSPGVICRSEGAGNTSIKTDLNVSRPLGIKGFPIRSEPVVISGPERPYGGPGRQAQSRGTIREGVSFGPGNRPLMLENAETTQNNELLLILFAHSGGLIAGYGGVLILLCVVAGARVAGSCSS